MEEGTSGEAQNLSEGEFVKILAGRGDHCICFWYQMTSAILKIVCIKYFYKKGP